MESLLELSNINRSFGAIDALRSVAFSIFPGEVMGLVGENGAGKSTLVKIISGFDNGYTGSLKLNKMETRFSSPGKAEKLGIAIAQQELSLIPTMSVAENIFLSGDVAPVFATKTALATKAKEYLSEVGLDYIDPLILVDRLSVGEQHLVEVARLIAHDPQILILDEPTAALGESDSIRILEMVNRLSERGKSIIYVSHRLDEIFKICDRITVLRDGKSIDALKVQGLDVNGLVEIMLGRELANMFPPRKKISKLNPLIRVKNLWPDGLLEPINFEIYPGEILGLAGQLGSGSGEVLATIAGAHKSRSGSLEFGDLNFLPRSPMEAIEAKIAYCSDDRKHDGLFLGRPIMENISSPSLKSISNFGIRSNATEEDLSRDISAKFTVDASRLSSEAGVLSGGNQQKVALGKWLSISPKVILVNEPTRGVDVGARAEIYQKLRDLASQGSAIVIASTDIQEITNLPDRVISFYRGEMIRELKLEDMTAINILSSITDPYSETNMKVEAR
jgi:ribose transport system ATP-binding protein